MKIIKVGITDDHAIFRKSLKLLVNSFENMKVVLEATDGLDLLNKITETELDVLLLDIQMPRLDGIETCKKLNVINPDLKILILTHLDNITTIKKVIDIGINGYFTKNTDSEELKIAIERVKDNGFYFERNLKPVINYIRQLDDTETGNIEIRYFTKRELEVLKLTLQELSGNQIANKLFISAKTVEKHKRNLMEKTRSKNFIGVIKYGLVHDFIDIDEFIE